MGAQRPGWLLPFTSRPCFRVCSFPLETAPPTRGREDVGHGVIRSAPNAPPRRQRERRTGTPRPVHREDGIHSSSEGPHLLPCSPFLKTTPHSLDSTHSSHQNLSSRSAEMGCAYATPRHKLAAYSIAPHVRLSRVREGNNLFTPAGTRYLSRLSHQQKSKC